MDKSTFKPGDVVVYRKQKHTTNPGRRAQQVYASQKGDYYTYVVEKFWVVGKVLEDDRLVLETRRGKKHIVDDQDPNLRRVTPWDRFRCQAQIAKLESATSARET